MTDAPNNGPEAGPARHDRAAAVPRPTPHQTIREEPGDGCYWLFRDQLMFAPYTCRRDGGVDWAYAGPADQAPYGLAGRLQQIHERLRRDDRGLSGWAKAYVALDELLGPFPAEVTTWTRWNGWACPRFTRQVAEQLVTENTRRQKDSESDQLTWDGDVVVCTTPAYAEGGFEPERYEPDQDGMYHIGSWAWVWSEVWCEDPQHADDPRPAVPVAVVKDVPIVVSEPQPSTIVTDRAYCAWCLNRARARRPEAEVTMLPPL